MANKTHVKLKLTSAIKTITSYTLRNEGLHSKGLFLICPQDNFITFSDIIKKYNKLAGKQPERRNVLEPFHCSLLCSSHEIPEWIAKPISWCAPFLNVQNSNKPWNAFLYFFALNLDWVFVTPDIFAECSCDFFPLKLCAYFNFERFIAHMGALGNICK